MQVMGSVLNRQLGVAARILMTGTIGGMCFALWVSADHVLSGARRAHVGRANARRLVVLETVPALARKQL
jgi:hypothetical protein